MADAPRKRIFVTGVNGHIGNHIVRDLLEHGYAVRGSVRNLNDPSKTDHVLAHAKQLGFEDRLELVEGDVLDADVWVNHLAGCDGLFHTATLYSTRDSATTILDTANKGTAHLLHAAAEAGIQRVVYTSSTAAVGNAPRGKLKDEAVWNEDTSLPYSVAKTQSERLAWSLSEELNLDLRVINPTAVLGGGFVQPTPSVDYFQDAMAGKYPVVPKFPMSVVHVRDVAIAHRRAFEVDEAEGRFILAPHANITLATICKRIRSLNPTTKSPRYSLPNTLIPLAVFQDWLGGKFGRQRYLTRAVAKNMMGGDTRYSSAKAENVLGMEWEDFDTCIQDTVDVFL
ncbi:MAG: NAD-dependent epimerase/dehydratase family protein [Candidatus Thermoplasmatota archaeon]|nr:NAD-dependent epimerase/dehydratase family protein [Candidatus Thermoplasmatota archaeon]